MARIWINRVLRWIGIAAFWLLLGWTLPYILVAPFFRLADIGRMLILGRAPVPNLNEGVIIFAGLAVWYLMTSPALRRTLGKIPVLLPALLVGYCATITTTVTAVVLYRGLVKTPEARWSISVFAILLLLGTRALAGWLFTKRPPETFIEL